MSISATLYPLFNTFVIYVIINSIFAVLAAQFFGEINDDLFGSFIKVYPFLCFAPYVFRRHALLIQRF